jgi:two-component sensor histidine kinase
MVFVPGIVLGTLLCGLRHGIALLIAFGLVTGYAFMPPRYSLVPEEEASVVQLVGYSAIGGFIVLLLAYLLALVHRLDHANRAKDALFHELQHRVANTLQIVTLTLEHARRGISDAAAVATIDQTAARVTALAQLHRTFYDSTAHQRGLGPILNRALLDAVMGLRRE